MIPPPELSKETTERLRSLRDRTVLIRRKLAQVTESLETTRSALEAETERGENDSEVRELLVHVLDDVERVTGRLRRGIADYQRTLADRPERLVVAFFGRTMAGKSTLVETLVGGSGEAIGSGGQRTTRESRYCPWGDVVLLDAPGIGAFQGEEDARIARRDVRDADLVIFVLTDDSIQEEVFRGLEHVHDENKPVLFVLNTKLNLRSEVLRDRFLRDPEKILGTEALRGHRARLDELARERLGISSYRVVPVHAQAAWLGTNEGDRALTDTSGVMDVVTAITGLVSRDAVPLRIRSTFDPSILEIERVGDQLADLRDDLIDQQRIFARRANDLDEQLRRMLRIHLRRVDATISGHLGARRTELRAWFESNLNEDDLEARFASWLAVDRLQESLDRDLRETASDIERSCEAVVEALQVDLEEHFARFEGLQPFDETDWHNILKRLEQGLKVAGLVVSLGFFFARVLGPIGIALTAVTATVGWLARKFPRVNVLRRRYIAYAVRETGEQLDQLGVIAADQAKEPIAQAITSGEPRELLRSLQRGADQLGAAAAVLNAGSVPVRRTSAELSTSLCRELIADGAATDLWARLPGRVVACRQPVDRLSSQHLSGALNESVIGLPTSRTEAIAQLFDGASPSWERGAVRVRLPADTPEDLEWRVRLAERIAERLVVVVPRTEPS